MAEIVQMRGKSGSGQCYMCQPKLLKSVMGGTLLRDADIGKGISYIMIIAGAKTVIWTNAFALFL